MLNIKKIKPVFNHILVTADVYSIADSSSIITDKEASGAIKEYQKVVAVGPSARGVEVGDMIAINPVRYEVRKYKDGSMNDGVIQQNKVISYNFPMVEVDGKTYMYLTDADISYIIEDYEEILPRTIVEEKDLSPGGIII